MGVFPRRLLCRVDTLLHEHQGSLLQSGCAGPQGLPGVNYYNECNVLKTRLFLRTASRDGCPILLVSDELLPELRGVSTLRP